MLEILYRFLGFLNQFGVWGMYALMLVVFTAMAVVTRGWSGAKITRGGVTSAAVNLLFLKISGLVAGAFGFIYLLTAQIYGQLDLPGLSRSFWDEQPFWLTAFVVLFVYDFSIYWVHRWLHHGWAWPMHAVHHSDRHMHFLSWSRGHPMEQAFIAAFLVVSMSWMGLGITDIAGVALIRALSQYYVHSNIDWDHGFLKYVFVSPQMHRWHHVDHPDAYDKNFSSIFSIFDVVFGTYYNPGSAVDMPTGVAEIPPHNLVRLFTHPFLAWADMLKARFGNADQTLKTPTTGT